MKTQVQLIGRVSGMDRDITVRKFKSAQERLEDQGYWVANPMEMVPEGTEYGKAMRICIGNLVKMDAVYLLRDWVDSPGGRAEVMVADAIGMTVMR